MKDRESSSRGLSAKYFLQKMVEKKTHIDNKSIEVGGSILWNDVTTCQQDTFSSESIQVNQELPQSLEKMKIMKHFGGIGRTI